MHSDSRPRSGGRPSPAANVSLIIETENEQEHRNIRLANNVAAWRRQTAANRVLEWILVGDREIREHEKRFLAGLPYRWIVRPGSTYYEQKNAGIDASRGAFVALADSDDQAEPDWLERAIAAMGEFSDDVAVITGRTRYAPGPFWKEMTIAHFPYQSANACPVLSIGAGNSLFRGDLLRRFRFEGDFIRHGADVDLASRLEQAGFRVIYDPGVQVLHNYTNKASEIWGHVAMTGHAFARYALFRGRHRRGALIETVGRYRVLLRRLWELRRLVGIPRWRIPVSAAFFAFYSVAAGYGFHCGRCGKPVPRFRF
jgi:glycosyltransferase involved in cell wall biosynthesis